MILGRNLLWVWVTSICFNMLFCFYQRQEPFSRALRFPDVEAILGKHCLGTTKTMGHELAVRGHVYWFLLISSTSAIEVCRGDGGNRWVLRADADAIVDHHWSTHWPRLIHPFPCSTSAIAEVFCSQARCASWWHRKSSMESIRRLLNISTCPFGGPQYVPCGFMKLAELAGLENTTCSSKVTNPGSGTRMVRGWYQVSPLPLTHVESCGSLTLKVLNWTGARGAMAFREFTGEWCGKVSWSEVSWPVRSDGL